MSRILVVDDEPAIGWSLRELLVDDGHEVEVSASVETAIETCGHFQPDAMLLDVRLPGRDGLSALPDLQALAPQARVIVMTAFGDLETAVRAVNGGAFEYLVKPFDLERVSQVVSRALTDLPGRAAPTVPGSGRSGARRRQRPRRRRTPRARDGRAGRGARGSLQEALRARAVPPLQRAGRNFHLPPHHGLPAPADGRRARVADGERPRHH
jgi:DNA-binding response OmpR family regulator